MVRRAVQELLARATGRAVAFSKDALEADELEYLKGLPSFVLETDEFVITRNPVIGSLPTSDPSDIVAPE